MLTTIPHSRYFTSLLLCSSFLGCSSAKKPVRKTSHLRGEVMLSISVAPDANQNTPIAVDILVINDKKLLQQLSALSAQAWFEKRTTFTRMHPSDLRVSSFEWVPGQQVSQVSIARAALAKGVILFANYSTPGDHSSLLPKRGITQIELGTKDFKIQPGRS